MKLVCFARDAITNDFVGLFDTIRTARLWVNKQDSWTAGEKDSVVYTMEPIVTDEDI